MTHLHNAARTLELLISAREPENVVTVSVRPDRSDASANLPATVQPRKLGPVLQDPHPVTDGRVALGGSPDHNGSKKEDGPLGVAALGIKFRVQHENSVAVSFRPRLDLGSLVIRRPKVHTASHEAHPPVPRKHGREVYGVKRSRSTRACFHAVGRRIGATA